MFKFFSSKNGNVRLAKRIVQLAVFNTLLVRMGLKFVCRQLLVGNSFQKLWKNVPRIFVQISYTPIQCLKPDNDVKPITDRGSNGELRRNDPSYQTAVFQQYV